MSYKKTVCQATRKIYHDTIGNMRDQKIVTGTSGRI